MTAGLFTGWNPDPEPVVPVPFFSEIRWTRIVTLNKPQCQHCVMVVHSGEAIPIQRARLERIGRDGSILELCEGHAAHQRDRDRK